ncbi:hypothetical protein AAFF_G00053550 [Aldrovandia affinis]|uniref:Uncharacterized protein n=1 Tax=Aldrovandia affinis TaxID=143900 RepID=A0AAD7S3E9_9TELE|nr:hypothetical protein AAFF_G00053550 [Aldrovandia affinis]
MPSVSHKPFTLGSCSVMCHVTRDEKFHWLLESSSLPGGAVSVRAGDHRVKGALPWDGGGGPEPSAITADSVFMARLQRHPLPKQALPLITFMATAIDREERP